MTTESHPCRTVWLTSFPKSGNTWVRAILTALAEHPHVFGVDRLEAGQQPHYLGGALARWGIDVRWLTDSELDAVRAELIRQADRTGPQSAPLMRKTHERFRVGPEGREAFPIDATRAAILIVRDPRDVACSYAAFFGMSVDRAIEAMSRDGGEHHANAALAQTAQPWGSWSGHAQSWLGASIPFPVHLIRYEDLHSDPVGVLLPVLSETGLDFTRDQLAGAVARTSFERLRESEVERGFHESSSHAERFFRRGQPGGWREQLTSDQLERILTYHGETMRMLGYLPPTDPMHLPAQLGIRVHEGTVPASLEHATRPRPWIQATSTSALVRFRGGGRILVEAGTEITIDSGTSGADQVGWMLQGWGVTLAMLQRGLLSLHASTVEVSGHVIAIAGNRGTGKSTTSMGLRGRGNHLLCDDVTVVEFRNAGAWTTPFWRNVHLLEDAAAAVGVDFASLPSLGTGRVKAAFRAESPQDVPRQIERIIVLSPDDESVSVHTFHPTGAARMTALLDHTVRDGIAPIVLGQDRYFALVAQLADVVPITVVSRPREGWSLDSVLDAIEADAAGSST